MEKTPWNFLLLAIVSLMALNRNVGAHTDVTPQQALDLIETTEDLIVLDVREPSEYCDARGHIRGALNYPLNTGVLYDRFAELPADKPILVVCRSGGRSNVASNFLDSQGFAEVYDMMGGMNAWPGETVPCKYAGGGGTADDPYEIATAADLIALGETPDDYDKHFVLTADIDLDPNLPGGRVFDNALIAPDANARESSFQGPHFTGVFDGNGQTIANLTVAAETHVGLFGRLSGEVRGLGIVDVNLAGSDCIGALAGYSDEGLVIDCYSTGALEGTWLVGGLLGENDGHVARSFSAAAIKAIKGIGGLVGRNQGTVDNCYSAAAIDAGVYFGGLVGDNEPNALVIHSYSASVLTSDPNRIDPNDIGGFGGLIGRNRGDVVGSFWDAEVSTFSPDSDGTGLATAEMQTAAPFLNAGWDFVCEAANGADNIWSIAEPNYPRFVWELDEAPTCPAVVLELNARNFDATIATGVVLVDFYATWCSHCDTQLPIMDEVAEQVQGQATVAKVDIDQARPLAQQYNVTAIPNLILFRDGEVIERFLGVTQAPVLTAAIEAALDYEPPARR